MTSDTQIVKVDVRKIGLEMRVQMLNTFWVKLGFGIMKIGAWIAGVTVVEEFPMSLIQKGDSDKRFLNG